jgi:hypothetical protein
MKVVETQERLTTKNPSMEVSFDNTTKTYIESMKNQMSEKDSKASENIAGLSDMLAFPELPDDFDDLSDKEKNDWYTGVITSYEKIMTTLRDNTSVVPSVQTVDDQTVLNYDEGERNLDDEEQKIYLSGLIAL